MSETLFWETWDWTGKESWSDCECGEYRESSRATVRSLEPWRISGLAQVVWVWLLVSGKFLYQKYKKILVYNEKEIGSVFLWLCTPHIRVSVPLYVPHSLAGGSRQGSPFIWAVHSAWQEKGIHSRLLQCRGYPSSSGMGNPLHCSQDWPKVSLLEEKDKEGTDLRLFEL